MQNADVKYPPAQAVSVKIEPVFQNPGPTEFSSLAMSMLPSRIKFEPSPEIKKYNHDVLETDAVKYGHTGDITVAGAVLHLLDPTGTVENSHAVIDVCSGIGTLTTPIAGTFQNVLALESNRHFVDRYTAYLKRPSGDEIRERVECKLVDISNVHYAIAQANEWLRSRHENPRHLHAVVLNPPFIRPALIAHSFFLACALRPKTIVAVMPLDILWELAGGYSSRCDEDWDSGKASSRYLQVQSDAMFVKGVRESAGWRLSKLIPHYRPDGTTEHATMQFTTDGDVEVLGEQSAGPNSHERRA